jgi:hypothetical protein
MQITAKQRKLILIGAAIMVASYAIHYVAVSAMNITSNVRPVAQPPKGNPFLTTRSIIPAAKPVSVSPPAPAPPPAAPATVAAPPMPPAPAPNTTPQAPVIPAPPPPGPIANGEQASPSQPENLLVQRVAALNGIWVGNAALGGRGMCRLRFEFHDDHQEQNHYQGFFQLWCNAVSQDRIDPEAATFTGTTDDAGITFKAATLIGTDSHGCAPTTFSIIPFGAGQIVGKWSEAHCPGGHMIMQRGR